MRKILLNNKTNRNDTHLASQIFQHQSELLTLERPLRGVGQDKGAHSRARAASRQPAPHHFVMRSQKSNNNTPRSQNKPSTKRKTVHLTLWVKPIVKAELTRIAAQEGLSVSATGGAFLEKAMQTNLDMQYGALLQPIIESAISKQMRGISTRLAWLLVRVAFDAGQTRSLVTNILGRQRGVTPKLLNDILDASSKTAKGNITRRTPQIIELIEAVEQWIVAEGRQ